MNWLKTTVRWPSATISSQLHQQLIELARRHVRVLRIDQTGREAEHPQQRERAEDDEPVAVQILQEPEHLLALPLQHGVVQRAVGGRRARRSSSCSCLGGSSGATSSFVRRRTSGRMRRRSRARRAARKGPPSCVLGHLAELDRLHVLLSEAPRRREQTRRRQRQQRPQLGEAVLERRSGDREGHGRAQLAHGAVLEGLRVLDELRLVEDDGGPLDRAELALVQAQQRVRRDRRRPRMPPTWAIGRPLFARVASTVCTRSPGAKRSASVRQIDMTDVGATTRNGRCSPVSFAWTMRASICSVLPRPMSSARMPPRRCRHRNASQSNPAR